VTSLAPPRHGGLSRRLDNVNVMLVDGSLPSSGTFELQYRSLGAPDITSEDVTTDMGDDVGGNVVDSLAPAA
jgi:hypothetical protein